MKFKKNYFIYVAILLLILLGIVYNLITKSTNVVQSNIYVVSKGNLDVIVKEEGTVNAKDIAFIYPEINGIVKKIYKNENNFVQKGEKLLELTNEEIEVNFKKAELNLKEQEIYLDEITSSEEKYIIKAPNDGYIEEIYVDVGDKINTGATLAKISINPDKTYVKAPFNGEQIKNIKSGQEAEVFFTDSFFKIKGKVKEINKKGEIKENGAIFYYITVEIDGNYFSDNKDPNAIIKVKTVKGVEESVQAGLIMEPEKKDIVSEVNGYVSKINFIKGSKVKKGEAIFVVNDDNIIKDKEKALISYKKAFLEYQLRKSQSEKLIIDSPINGKIVEINVKEGDNITQNLFATKPIAVIADYSEFKIIVPFDEIDAVKIKQGMPANITFDSLPGTICKGIVEKVADIGKKNNDVTTYDVTILIEKNNDVKPGMNANVEIITDRREGILIVPLSAIVKKENKFYVNVIDEKNNKTSLREIQIGIKNGEFVEVINGLKEGEKITVKSNI
ncbi:efflux RND transporter periplasmic adaptor subunit [Thermovenabulum gondwanense]|uniref:Macrolide export protein MacA n=1 Tax=Thermovenabulum gondwanense TaxID=520767 RepID=A0A162M825_9FIRM|nr:HlyD family efflux transporter periplasmic adaptor subunit [Thermovenabulum gondwanense]KYO64497.1 Macrolide export protein MacA [Thermovenabulum gondwanense]